MGGWQPIYKMVANTPTVLCIRIHCSWKSNGLVPSLPFRLWQSHLRLPEVHFYSTSSLARLSSLLPLTLPYPGSHPSKSHVYPQQDAPNLTTASSLIKKKGSCPFGADCKFTHKCARCQGGHPLSSCHNKPA